MKQIPLSQGLYALVDDEDYEALAVHKWHARKKPRTFYAARNSAGKKIFMHVALGYSRPDHRDGNGLNNQRHNLRPASKAQNAQNNPRHLDNKSGFKGVSPQGNRWQADIRVDGKNRYLGCRALASEAAKLYDEAAVKHFGEYARVNFPWQT
jgi:hypothetical protein